MTKELFLKTYFKNLIIAKNKSPKKYDWESSDVLEVYRRMVESFSEGTYSRHCDAIRMTLKELKLKNNRESIDSIFQTINEEKVS